MACTEVRDLMKRGVHLTSTVHHQPRCARVPGLPSSFPTVPCVRVTCHSIWQLAGGTARVKRVV